MKLDATKIILILVALLQSLIIYIGVDIQSRLNRLELGMMIATQAGGFDHVVDLLVDKPSMTDDQEKYVEEVLEESE